MGPHLRGMAAGRHVPGLLLSGMQDAFLKENAGAARRNPMRRFKRSDLFLYVIGKDEPRAAIVATKYAGHFEVSAHASSLSG
jgi:hypothetical protein